MVFSSSIFLFLFLPLTIAAYIAAPRLTRNGVLLAASLFFYAWGEKGYVFLMLSSIAFNYVWGIVVEKNRELRFGTALLTLGVAANIGLLVVFKYSNFVFANLNGILADFGQSPLQLKPVHLPIGISFFVFEAIAYLVDIRRGLTRAQRDPISFGLFMTLFPHLIAGPVVRYRDLEDALGARSLSVYQFAAGVRRFIVGLSKKVLLSNSLALTADAIFNQPPSQLAASAAWLGVLCYTLHIYFDFSGYSDMAIGLGRLFGFELCENFRYPYAASSITDFWRRWHISLSTWFRDYLYIPLGGNRRGVMRTAFNLVTVFALCGLWHGANWTFVVWGLYHGMLLVLERVAGRGGPIGASSIFYRLTTLLLVMIGWVFFRCETLDQALRMIRVMFDLGTSGHSLTSFWTLELGIVLCAAGLISQPVCPTIRAWCDQIANSGHLAIVMRLVEGVILLGLLAVCTMYLAAGTYNPFIYYRF